MAEASGEFRTSDMALATVLKMNNLVADRMELLEGRSAIWVYDSEANLRSTVDTYQQGAARVDPRDFVQQLGSVRREMYRFLEESRVAQTG